MTAMRFNIAFKLSFLITLILVGVVLIMTFRLSRLVYLENKEKYGNSLMSIASTAALRIDAAEHDKVRRPGDEVKEEFKKIKAYLKEVQIVNGLELDSIYTFHINEEGKLRFGVMLYKDPFIGNQYEPPPQNQVLFDQILKEGKPLYTSIYKDDHGTWISGLAPIKNKKGKVVGILEADYRLERVIVEMQNNLLSIILGGVVLVIVSLIVSIFMSYGFTRPIQTLRYASMQVAEGNFSKSKLPIYSNDEIGDLARDFEGMTHSLRERLHLLKYVSKDTLEMINKMITHEVDQRGELKELTILFSDIRGFTNFSEGREPKVVIEVLNQYLAAQSEIVKQHRGRIDKYVGDEIIALFEGKDSSEQAVACACEMQEAVKKVNDNNMKKSTNDMIHETTVEEPSDMQVGIGIAKGEVFMGSIGGTDLKDYTAIGSYMNLAARVCSQTPPKGIIVTEEVKNSITHTALMDDILFEKNEAIVYKGFSGPIQVYRVERLTRRVFGATRGKSEDFASF